MSKYNTHRHDVILTALVSIFTLGVSAMIGERFTGAVSGVPMCDGLSATIYINDANVVVGGPDAGKAYKGIFNGSNADDVIVGTDSKDNISGKKGNDVICGGADDDTLSGDDGSDVLFGEGGDDRIDGNQKDDRILGGTGNDVIDGGDGSDALCGNADNDRISGHQDDDQIDGGLGVDSLDGDTGTDVCRNGETVTQCEESAPGFIAVCGDAGSSSSSGSSDSASSSSGGTSASSASSDGSSTSSSMSSDAGTSSSASSVESSSSSSSSSSSQSAGGDGAPSTNVFHGASTVHHGGPKGEIVFASFRGSGIAELAAVTHNALVQYGLHEDSPYKYTFHHENIRPAAFASDDVAMDWTLRAHAACCSIYRYLTRLREARVMIKPGYIDWLTGQLATSLNEDPVEIRAAFLGAPHTHPHTSDLVRSITAEGCTDNNYQYGAAPSDGGDAEHDHSLHMEHVLDVASTGESLAIQKQENPGEIAFAVMDGEKVFTDFGVSHTKEMHLLIVRDNLRYFQHFHPARDADGFWHVPFTPSGGGAYWMYADFVGIDDKPHTIRFDRTYPLDPGSSGIVRDFRTEKPVGKYAIRMEATPYTEGMLFTLRIRDAVYNDAPILEPYLGAMGHGIIISPTGDFIHTHPSPAGDSLIFHTPALTGDFYRIFTQFQIQGEIFTVEFDWVP